MAVRGRDLIHRTIERIRRLGHTVRDVGRAAWVRFRARVPPGWRAVVILLVAEAGGVLVVVLYLAFSGKALVVSFEQPPVEAATAPTSDLIIPVSGVAAVELDDNFGAPRTANRTHQGLDIRAPAGTPVLAAASGVIVRMDSSRAGGTTIHERALDGRTVLYYAHLQRRARGLDVGDLVRQGDTIAYVGDSGNARGIPHLHFAVYTVSDPNAVSNGRHFDPYPLLVDTAG